MNKIFYLASALALFASCSGGADHTNDTPSADTSAPANTVADLSYSFKQYSPHDTTSFTEGLFIHEGKLYESTGSPEDLPYTRSVFGIVDTKTGKIDVKGELDRSKYFGEGIVLLKDKIYQLTYKNQQGFVYDAKTFKKLKDFRFASAEGWGMTTDGTNLIMSDGTSKLTFLDPETLQPVRSIEVTDDGYRKQYLNELEYINGFIYANIWTTNQIVKIDPNTGVVTGRLNLDNVFTDARNRYGMSSEMNGIAFDAQNNKVYITGKLWPAIYELEFAH